MKIANEAGEVFPDTMGAMVTFHRLTWDDSVETFSMRAGGNINYHSLKGGTALHGHDFPEIFLVLSGKIAHVVNGERRELPAGTLVFIRPSDRHQFEQVGDESCELVNFAYSLETLMDLSVYLEDDYFMRRFTAPVLPPVFKLSLVETEKIALELLRINTLRLQSPERARIKVKMELGELFISYFLEFVESGDSLSSGDTPKWLDELVAAMRQPKNFTRGMERMRQLACRTPEHICKTMRKYLDKTPSEFLNELRVNHAAYLLRETDEEIYAIATDLNFKSLSQFYHLFRGAYGTSPAKYRTISRRSDIPV